MPQPHLYIRDVCLVFQSVRCRGCSQRVQAQPIHRDPGVFTVLLEQLVDPIPGQCLIEHAGSVVLDGPKQRPLAVFPMPREGE